MKEIIEQLKAAIAAEQKKNPTSALSVIGAHVQAIEERLAEHLQQTPPVAPAGGTPAVPGEAPTPTANS